VINDHLGCGVCLSEDAIQGPGGCYGAFSVVDDRAGQGECDFTVVGSAVIHCYPEVLVRAGIGDRKTVAGVE